MKHLASFVMLIAAGLMTTACEVKSASDYHLDEIDAYISVEGEGGYDDYRMRNLKVRAEFQPDDELLTYLVLSNRDDIYANLNGGSSQRMREDNFLGHVDYRTTLSGGYEGDSVRVTLSRDVDSRDAQSRVDIPHSVYDVQITDSSQYGYINNRQSVRSVLVGGPRGRILDRHCQPLADNRVSPSIVSCPENFQKRTWEATILEISNGIDRVSAAIGRPSTLSMRAIQRHVKQSLALPLTVWRNLSVVELARFCEHGQDFPGFSVREEVERAYPNGELAAHAIGWVGSTVMEAEPGDERFYFITPELHGKSGVEYQYDAFLSGVPGERKVLVDARGFAIREWSVVEEQRGPDLTLTLDLGIQRAVEQQLSGRPAVAGPASSWIRVPARSWPLRALRRMT